jgi:ADP-ribose pyrophosphatase YjhB (NUDIX family)
VERQGKDVGDGAKEAGIDSAKRAAVRETREETGLDISGCDIEHLSTFRSDTANGNYLTHIFYVRLPEGMPIEIELSKGQPFKEHDRAVWLKGEVMTGQISGTMSSLRDRMGALEHGDVPRARSDYTAVMWEIVERGLVRAHEVARPNTGQQRVHRIH